MPMIGRKILFASTVLAAGVLLGGCAVHGGAIVYVPNGPPTVVAEVTTTSPGGGYVWVPGYHSWNGSAYVWVGGRWERPPHGRAHWEAGRWQHGQHGWYWRDGRWR
jgi:hypothetical protein